MRDLLNLIPKAYLYMPLESGGEIYKTEVKTNARLRSTAKRLGLAFD